MRLLIAFAALISFNALAAAAVAEDQTVPAGTVVQCVRSGERLCEESQFLTNVSDAVLQKTEQTCNQHGGMFTYGMCSSAQHIGTCRSLRDSVEVKVRAYAPMLESQARENCNRLGGNFSTSY
jgi:hypothetical protein